MLRVLVACGAARLRIRRLGLRAAWIWPLVWEIALLRARSAIFCSIVKARKIWTVGGGIPKISMERKFAFAERCSEARISARVPLNYVINVFETAISCKIG